MRAFTGLIFENKISGFNATSLIWTLPEFLSSIIPFISISPQIKFELKNLS